MVEPAPDAPACADGVCTVKLTPAQLLDAAQKLVLARRFDEARPYIAALLAAPQVKMQAHFLAGYVAEETGDLETAAREFRIVLRDHPEITRARLELARVLQLQGNDAAAEHHYRLAAQASDLPPEIEATIRTQRGILRNRKTWHLNVTAGIAPDSNINNATDARAIDITLGTTTIPIALDQAARRTSGIGETASFSGGARLRLSDKAVWLVDADGNGVNYKGSIADDYSLLLASGPEIAIGSESHVSVEAIAAQRWYGGKTAARGFGGRLSYQRNLDAGQRIGVQIDARHNASDYGPDFEGWQGGASASYERVVHRMAIASVTLFARREKLGAAAYSSHEFGGTIGIGGELPHGLNAGISGGASRAIFDAPFYFFSDDPRHDWRFNARAYLGARSIRVFGFSPSITYSFSGIESTLPLYTSNRHRLEFALARYF